MGKATNIPTGISQDELDFLDVDQLDKEIQLSIENLGTGEHTVKFLSLDFKKARTAKGVDRFDMLLELVKTDNAGLMVGKKYIIPFFKDDWGYGVKNLARFYKEVSGDETPQKWVALLKEIKDLVGFSFPIKAAVKEKAGVAVLDGNGNPCMQYNYGLLIQ